MSPLPFSSPFESTTSKTVSSKDDTASKSPAGSGKTADEIEDLLNYESDDKDDKDDKDNNKGKVKDEEDDLEPDTKKDDDDEDVDLDDDDEDDKDEDDKDDEDEEEDRVKLKEDDEEDDEEKEKLDLKDEDEEDKKVTAPPKVKEIEKEFPEFFKKFPFIKRMMFRDRAYTEMFGSFDEAKEVYNKVERLNEFESQALNGDIKDYLSSIKEANPKAFDTVVDTFFKQLAEVDKSAYDDITQNFARQIINGIADEAKRKDNKELNKLARDLYEWLFDESADKPTHMEYKIRVKQEKSEEQNKIDKERQEFLKERFEVARDGLSNKVDNILKATIGEYIDPRGQMSGFEKKTAIVETLKRLHQRIGQDGAFRKNLDRLWKASMNEKFSENSLIGIKKSYLGKAKTLLTSVIKEVRTEVLKDNRSKGREKQDKTPSEETSTRKSVNAGRPHQQTTKANERKQGETVEEFLMRD